MNWLKTDISLDGWRFDFARGYAGRLLGILREAVKGELNARIPLHSHPLGIPFICCLLVVYSVLVLYTLYVRIPSTVTQKATSRRVGQYHQLRRPFTYNKSLLRLLNLIFKPIEKEIGGELIIQWNAKQGPDNSYERPLA
eukprot:Gb_22335 [translate_table: standard]